MTVNCWTTVILLYKSALVFTVITVCITAQSMGRVYAIDAPPHFLLSNKPNDCTANFPEKYHQPRQRRN
jgi:hypothetical protein